VKSIYIFVHKLILKNMNEIRKRHERNDELSCVLLNNLSDEEKIVIELLKLEFNEKTASRAIKKKLNSLFIQSLKEIKL